MAQHAAGRPHGREEVVAAVVDAATTLFAERGPAATSLRDVARAADVNLGLIHRHIGSKKDLLATVLKARPGMPSGEIRDPEEAATVLLRSVFSPPPYTLILIRAAVDGYDLTQLGVEFPLVDRAREVLRSRLTAVDADLRVALLTALVLGWHAMGRTMLHVVGHPSLSPDEIVSSLEPGVTALLAAPGEHRHPAGRSIGG